MPGPVTHTPVYRGSNYDGNGVLHSSEKARGITLVPDKSGKGFRKIGGDIKKTANIQDSSFTKQNEKIEKLEKQIEAKDKVIQDYAALVKDMDKRLKALENK